MYNDRRELRQECQRPLTQATIVGSHLSQTVSQFIESKGLSVGLIPRSIDRGLIEDHLGCRPAIPRKDGLIDCVVGRSIPRSIDRGLIEASSSWRTGAPARR